MKIGLLLSAGALVVAAVAVAAMPPQDARAKSREDESAAKPGMDTAAMHAQMVEMNKPGPEHAEMKKMVGTWQVAVKTWDDPAQSPDNSTGTSIIEMANDRQLLEHFTGTFAEMGKYEGWGVLAFNNATKEYEHVWRDNMNTGLMWSTGKKAADGTLTMTGKSTCAMGPMTCRTVSKMNGDNAYHFEMYCTIQGMPEMKMMEMDYTKGGAGSR
jgi:Protein of unknown function (DUF1579)